MHLSFISNVELPWVVAALCLSAISMCAASRLHGAVLRAAGYSLPQSSLLAITYASNAVSVTMPLAGSPVGTGFTYRELRREGIDAAPAGWTLLVSGIVSLSALAFLFAGGLGIEADRRHVVLSGLTTMVGVAPLIVFLIASRSAVVARHVDRLVTSEPRRMGPCPSIRASGPAGAGGVCDRAALELPTRPALGRSGAGVGDVELGDRRCFSWLSA